VAEELAEWREDVAERIGSQVVLVAVPPGWGRSAVLRQFAAVAVGDDGPITLVAVISGDLPPGRAVQAQALREAITAFSGEPRVIRLLELDTTAGQMQLGLGLGSLVVSGLAAAVSLLVASLTVTAAGNVWDGSPAGEAGGVARAARALARVSVSVPVVVVVVDDADCLDVGLALALIRGLAGRRDGQVLVVAAAAPGSDLVRTLTGEPGYELAGRVHRAEADPQMGYAARAELAAELLPGLPAAGAERIARRTATFAEVFAVADSGRLAELDPDTGVADAVGVVDAVTDAVLERARPSPEAVVLSWAGGALHDRQAAKALEVLGASRQDGDQRVVRADALVRLAGPADARVAEGVAALSMADRRELAAAVLGEAAGLVADASAGLVERVVARQAAHRVRPDHLSTLAARGNIATWTGEGGDAAGALRLFQELLPDQIRVLGPDHPDSLTARDNIAALTRDGGDAAGALRLFQELLPDQIRVLGPDHPDTLTARIKIAALTGDGGDPPGALRLYGELLPDLVRVLGPDHPGTLATRIKIAALTGDGGDPPGALRLFQELLPNLVQVLGPDHPDTLTARNGIAAWTEVLSASTQRPDGAVETEEPGNPGALLI
jgi:hypothetical protein